MSVIRLPLRLEVLGSAFKGLSDQLSARDEWDKETGGVVIGQFDGGQWLIDEFRIDSTATSSPGIVVLSPHLVSEARAGLVRAQQSEPDAISRFVRAVAGTWHTHPPGFDSFSATDRTYLFLDRLRLLSDNPGNADVPWVHFVFSNFGAPPLRFRVFGMRVDSRFRFGMGAELRNDVSTLQAPEPNHPFGLGVISKDPGGSLTIKPYLPEHLQPAVGGSTKPIGLWRRSIHFYSSRELEDIFLENFAQKTGLTEFPFILDLGPGTKVHREVVLAARDSSEWNLEKLVRFEELVPRNYYVFNE